MSEATKNINAEKIQGNLAVNSLSAYTTTTTTNFRMISGATTGYVLTAIDNDGNAAWLPATGSSGGTGVDTYVTGFTYNNANKLTISQNQGQAPLDVFINTMTGLTVNGNVLVNGYVSATTIYNTSGNSFLYNITASTMFVDWIDFNQNATVPSANGRISWDSGTGTLNIGVGSSTTATIDLQVGQEEIVRVYNSEATTLTKGTVVYVSGSQGNRPAVKRAIATNDGYSVTTLGIVDANITSGAEGYVTTFGIISNLDTTGLTGGTPIWLSPVSAGTFTTTKPIAPDHTVLLGYVVRVDNNVGSVFVNISNGWEITELHDVRISGATVGDLLVKSEYNGINVWINSKTLPGNYLIAGNLNVTGTTTSHILSATTVYASSVGVSGNCVTNAYIGNLHGCSPITVHDSIKNNGSTVSGTSSFAFGSGVIASGNYSHAEGRETISSGQYSHAEGYSTQAIGENSHAEGYITVVTGNASHAEGSNNQAIGNYSHAEGDSTNSFGVSSHSEGSTTKTLTDYSHTEGTLTSTGQYGYSLDSVVAGVLTINTSYGDVSGFFSNYVILYDSGTNSLNYYLIVSSTWDGTNTVITLEDSGVNSGTYVGVPFNPNPDNADQVLTPFTGQHAEGSSSISLGASSHAEGYATTTIGNYSHTEGYRTVSIGQYSHAEGTGTTTNGIASHAEGENTTTVGNWSHAEGYTTTATGHYSHAEGYANNASGLASHTEGLSTTASGDYSHAEGSASSASGYASHAEGGSSAIGNFSHSQGIGSTSYGLGSFASGSGSTAQGNYSFVHSINSIASGEGTVVLGGIGITGTTPNMVYVSTLNINSIPANNNSATEVLVRNSSTGDVEYRDASSLSGSGTTGVDTYVTGFTYSNNNLTISQNQGQPPLTVDISVMTGLTVNGPLSASTIFITTNPTLNNDNTEILTLNTTTNQIEYSDATSTAIYNYGVSFAMGTSNFLT